MNQLRQLADILGYYRLRHLSMDERMALAKMFACLAAAIFFGSLLS